MINELFILTAAHCVVYEDEGAFNRTDQALWNKLTIMVGAIVPYPDDKNTTTHQLKSVESVILHRWWRTTNTMRWDAALVQVRLRVTCMPRRRFESPDPLWS